MTENLARIQGVWRKTLHNQDVWELNLYTGEITFKPHEFLFEHELPDAAGRNARWLALKEEDVYESTFDCFSYEVLKKMQQCVKEEAKRNHRLPPPDKSFHVEKGYKRFLLSEFIMSREGWADYRDKLAEKTRGGGAIPVPNKKGQIEFPWENYQWTRFNCPGMLAENVLDEIWSLRENDPAAYHKWVTSRILGKIYAEGQDLVDIRPGTRRTRFDFTTLMAYRLVIENDWYFDAVMMYYMNIYFARVARTSKHNIVELSWDDSGQKSYRILDQKAWITWFENRKTTLPNYAELELMFSQRRTDGRDGYPKFGLKPTRLPQNIASCWLSHPLHVTYNDYTFTPLPDTLEFDPDFELAPQDEGKFNMWCGFAIPYAKAKEVWDRYQLINEHCSQELQEQKSKMMRAVNFFFYHLRMVICGGFKQHYLHLVRWMAHLLQRPYDKMKITVVIKGPQGVGKNLIFKVLRLIMGKTHSVEIAASRMMDKFNSYYTEAKILVVADEMTRSDASNADLKIKGTAEENVVERKGIDAVVVPNYSNFVITTNARGGKGVVDLDHDDRRGYCISCDERQDGLTAYDFLAKQLVDKKAVEGMTADELGSKKPLIRKLWFKWWVNRLWKRNIPKDPVFMIAYLLYTWDDWGGDGGIEDWDECEFPASSFRQECIFSSEDVIGRWWQDCLLRGYHVDPAKLKEEERTYEVDEPSWMLLVPKEMFYAQFLEDCRKQNSRMSLPLQGNFMARINLLTARKITLKKPSQHMRAAGRTSKLEFPPKSVMEEHFARHYGIDRTTLRSFSKNSFLTFDDNDAGGADAGPNPRTPPPSPPPDPNQPPPNILPPSSMAADWTLPMSTGYNDDQILVRQIMGMAAKQTDDPNARWELSNEIVLRLQDEINRIREMDIQRANAPVTNQQPTIHQALQMPRAPVPRLRPTPSPRTPNSPKPKSPRKKPTTKKTTKKRKNPYVDDEAQVSGSDSGDDDEVSDYDELLNEDSQSQHDGLDDLLCSSQDVPLNRLRRNTGSD